MEETKQYNTIGTKKKKDFILQQKNMRSVAALDTSTEIGRLCNRNQGNSTIVRFKKQSFRETLLANHWGRYIG